MRPLFIVAHFLVFASLAWAAESVGVAGSALAAVPPSRIAQVLERQPVGPVGVGRPIEDRVYWSQPRQEALVKPFLAEAERYRTATFPAWSDSDYLVYSQTGDRKQGEKMLAAREQWLKPLVLAECWENQGRFLPALSTALAGYLDQPSWLLPAHDGDLKVFHQKVQYVDLNCAQFGADLAEAWYLVGSRLEPALRDRLKNEILRRLVNPVRSSFQTGQGHSWLTVRHNWNAVCLGGSTSAALIVLDDPAARAAFMACAEYAVQNSFLGYRDDGYDDEGGGYHNYGFGNLVALRERLRDGSGGVVDLFRDPRAAKAARFGIDYVLTDRLMPTFADSQVNGRVKLGLVSALRRVFRETATEDGTTIGHRLNIYLQVPTPLGADEVTAMPPSSPLRSYWDSVGVLVARPTPSTDSVLAVAIKNAGNGNHSHNDIGSWCLSVGDQMVAGDPGGPAHYRADTFGPLRYVKYRMLNSFGHPVPVIDGHLQVDATKVQGRVVSTSFTDDEDRIVIDGTVAYDVPALTRWERTLVYSRSGRGSVRVEDSITATTPIALEFGFTCRGTLTFPRPDRLVITHQGKVLEVVIEGPAVEVEQEDITEMDAPLFHRLGFRLKEPVTHARFAITMRPLESAATTKVP